MSQKQTIAIILPRVLQPDAWLKMSDDVVFIEGVLEGAAELAKAAEKNGILCIISRGSTSVLISEAVNIPVVAIEATTYDVLETLILMKQSHPQIDRVALLSFHNLNYDVDKIGKIAGLDVELFWYKDFTQMKNAVKEAYQKGIRAIVGSPLVDEYAESLGMRWFLLKIGKEATMRAIQRARSIVSMAKGDQTKTNQMRQIFDSLQDGIIAIDSSGSIIFFNNKSELLFNISKSNAIGRPLYDILPDINWNEILRVRSGQIKSATNEKVDVTVNHLTDTPEHDTNLITLTLKYSEKIYQQDTMQRKSTPNFMFKTKYTFDDVIGKSRAIRASITEAKQIAKSDSSVLILGESGTGKEIFAQAIHHMSSRKNGPFVAINCAAFPKHLLESELFGYEDGAFTGAKRGGKKGVFELATSGTLFLDEIGDMPLDLQSRFLRVLEQKCFMRIGSEKIVTVNARTISATNRNLHNLLESGNFRSDLYYRINALSIVLPPLRDRKEDIPLLVNHFMNNYSFSYNKKIEEIPKTIMELLEQYDWPGNVRELAHCIERLVVLDESKVNDDNMVNVEGMLFEKNLNHRSMPVTSKSNHQRMRDPYLIEIRIDKLDSMLNEIIQKACELKGDNITDVAELLGISRTTIWKRRKNIKN